MKPEALELLDQIRNVESDGRRGGVWGTSAVPVPHVGRGKPDSAPSGGRLLLKPMEVADLLGLSRSKVFEMLAAEELPVVRIGRAVRVPQADLREWIKARTNWHPNQAQVPAIRNLGRDLVRGTSR